MTTYSPTSLEDCLRVDNVTAFSIDVLRKMLPDVKTALFFAKLYELDAQNLARLLHLVFNTTVTEALTNGDHSTDLQDYLIDVVPDVVNEGQVDFGAQPPPAYVLPEIWAELEIQVAQSIKDVAAKVGSLIHSMPSSKEGEMFFQTLNKMNKLRPTMGSFQAGVKHARVAPNLVVFDVSGSMSETTVTQIVDEVVALAWKADAHLAIVSNDTFHWEPGTYSSEKVLKHAQFGGTHYETLLPLFEMRSWGQVITIADYDSSYAAKEVFFRSASLGQIGKILDVSLVNRQTFLSEVLSKNAAEVDSVLLAEGRTPSRLH